MKNISNIVWGLALIVVGLIAGANILNIINVNLFFEGWWTLFIIIPCFVGLFEDDNKTFSIIGLLIGIALLLCAQDLISFELVWKLAFPVILVVIGLSFIFKDILKKETTKKIKELNSKKKDNNNCLALFSGQKISFDKKVIKGTNLTAIFGGVECDLKDALIEEDIVINATSFFGGVDIIVPDTVDVVIKSNSLFGGADDKRKKKKEGKKHHTIYINAICIFGGVDIK